MAPSKKASRQGANMPPAPAVREALDDGLVRILAPNPSPMTYWGTNTYLLGHRHIAVIDPGPDDPTHLDTIIAALPDRAEVTHICVTHAHLDHSPGAATLSDRTGAPVYAFGDAAAGRSAVMARLAAEGLTGGGEGVDKDFAPDICLADGDILSTPDWDLQALHTPGHMGNHLSFAFGDVLFCGDLVMGWSSSLVSPPDGDLTDFMRSCRRLTERPWLRFHPGHGLHIDAPAARLEWLISHRLSREAQILEALNEGPATAKSIAARIYSETPAQLLPAATRNVFAHLIDLAGRSVVQAAPQLASDAIFSRL